MNTINIDSNKVISNELENININSNIINDSNLSPSPRPLTPNTQDYCSKHLCYAPKIKRIENKTSKQFKNFSLD